MKMAAVLMVAAALPMFLPAQSSALEPSTKVELRVETLANREGAPLQPCEVVQVKPGSGVVPYVSFISWSTLGEAERSESGFKLRDSAIRCQAGASAPVSPPVSNGAFVPYMYDQISMTMGWDPGTMDPGPVSAFLINLTLTTRRLTGFSPEGRSVYTDLVQDRRTIRLEQGEEFFLPIPALDSAARETLGVREVLLRIRAGWAGRTGAMEYGRIEVMSAAPGSEILLDGSSAGRARSDGSAVLANVPVGLREVHIRGASGPVVSRWVQVMKGRSVAVSPEAARDMASQQFVTPAGKNVEGFQEYRRTRDGAIMVQIPEGEFLMGNLETEGSPLPHTVDVSSFLMDKLPVTVGQFKRFAGATGNPLPPDPYWGVHDNFPVSFIRWDEARAYCEWAGGRLPTEAEREKATRGTDGRMWPWGSEPPSPDRGVHWRNWGELGADAVGIRPKGASPYGLLDTGGNMWEFCEDWWDENYFKVSPKKDPRGPKTGRARVVKGGSWDSRPAVLSASSRNFAYIGYREGDFGFRCAADPLR
jgi:formylglycine-generating enzyme required for sulfatase activity